MLNLRNASLSPGEGGVAPVIIQRREMNPIKIDGDPPNDTWVGVTILVYKGGTLHSKTICKVYISSIKMNMIKYYTLAVLCLGQAVPSPNA